MFDMNITEHISANGLSREKICQEAGISRAFLSLIERNERSPGPQTVGRLAKALGVSVRDLRPDLAGLFGDAA
ncbi:helix-turn-helix domain-containing protein [Leisingera methylohalidivorans]|uniref:XRE family transcriptional regulator n=1 Tax=Leisingera methylohalidivorans DSM 14336 TaxID=999552 RepID=V9VP43_9RHOB|nr:helix-turn-helix transcriptional regulator [Leisingera methylohalidivorans]AHD00461.1 XRE family transcriptional regulator [Leisingera methylohalidivorans DSM 14336]